MERLVASILHAKVKVEHSVVAHLWTNMGSDTVTRERQEVASMSIAYCDGTTERWMGEERLDGDSLVSPRCLERHAMTQRRGRESARVLIVSESDDLRLIMREMLQSEGYEPVVLRDLADVAGDAPHCVVALLDLGRQIYEVCVPSIVKKLWDLHPGVSVIILTGHDSDDRLLEEALPVGPWLKLRKPYDISHLKATLRQCIG